MTQVLMLPFHVGEERLAIPAAQVVEVVPQVRLTRVPRAPEALAGVFDYRGAIIPVIDACRLLIDRDCRAVLSTRIIVLAVIDDGVVTSSARCGLLVERVTEATALDHAAVHPRSLAGGSGLVLTGAASDEGGILQLFDAAALEPLLGETPRPLS